MGGKGIQGHSSVRGRPGVSSFFRALASFASWAFLVLAIAFAIVWPLWSLATKDRQAYTITIGAAVFLVVTFFIARAARRRSSSKSRRPPE